MISELVSEPELDILQVATEVVLCVNQHRKELAVLMQQVKLCSPFYSWSSLSSMLPPVVKLCCCTLRDLPENQV